MSLHCGIANDGRLRVFFVWLSLSFFFLAILPFHRMLHWGSVSLSKLDFPMCLGHHASHGATKDRIGRTSGTRGGTIEGLALDANRQTAQNDGGAKEAIVASNQSDVVLVQAQAVLFSQDQGCGRRGRTRTQQNLEAHAGDGTGFFAHVARLATAATPVISLAALVVAPPASGIHVIQDALAHCHLAADATEHGRTPASGLLAGGLAQFDLELGGFFRKGPVGRSVGSLADFVALEGFF